MARPGEPAGEPEGKSGNSSVGKRGMIDQFPDLLPSALAVTDQFRLAKPLAIRRDQ
jgi:hypothetical protein